MVTVNKIFDSFSDEVKQDLIRMRRSGSTNLECKIWLEEFHGVIVSLETVRKGLMELAGVVNPVSSSLMVEEEVLIERVKQDRLLEAHRSESSHYRKLYNALLKESSDIEKVVEVAREVTLAIPGARVPTRQVAPGPLHDQVAIAPLCDTHIGEYIDADQMGGLNEYDMEIFNRRLYGWSTKIVELVQLRENYVNVPTLYVPMLGDMISGDIHLELVKSNLDNVMNTMIRGAHMIAQALVFLSQHFEEIQVPCVVGNHGRMTQKPPSKDKYVDWDYLLYQWVASFCRENPRIKFTIPKSFIHVFEVANKNILIMHGDSIRGWSGIPFYGMIRALAQLRQTLQFRKGLEEDLEKAKKNPNEMVNVLATYFDTVMLGHFHTQNELDIGTGVVMVCGCMKGADEYAFSRLHVGSRPTQVLTYWNEDHGYVGKEIIYLDGFNHAEGQYVDELPSVWAEAEV